VERRKAVEKVENEQGKENDVKAEERGQDKSVDK
jgi:hypothetical protein